MLQKKKALKWLGIFIAAQLAAIMLTVYLFDPFYQYHSPLGGLQPVLYDRDNQMMGSVRSLPYDSVLLGSSVAENFDSSVLDAMYGGHTLKVIKASGSVADLMYYLDAAREEHPLERIFWCMDIFALTSSPEVTLYSEDIPRYLHTKTILDDVPYLLNKEILFNKIPLMLAYSKMGINTGGHAYDWSAGKVFSAEKAMQAYEKPDHALEMQPMGHDAEKAEQNLSMVMNEINTHPETEYTIFFPPYSMLWWDCGYVNGVSDTYFYVLKRTLSSLLGCDNVSVYFFMSDREIICDLDNYMDMIHYSPAINAYMLDCIAEDKNKVTPDNLGDVINQMHEAYDYIIQEAIYQYYD